MSIRFRAVPALGAVALAAGLGLSAQPALAQPIGAADSTAATSVAHAAKPTMCEPGIRAYVITSKKGVWTVAHAHGKTVAAGATYKSKYRMFYETQLISNYSVSGGGSLSANVAKKILGKAEIEVKGSLASYKKKTTKKDTFQQITLKGPKKGTRYYSVFDGGKRWTGTWSYRECKKDASGWRELNHGNWKSYRQFDDGIALCPAKNYKKGSLEYKACKATGH